MLPAVGTYTWRVNGTESATGFGSRSLPATAKTVAHTEGNDVVLDTTYSR